MKVKITQDLLVVDVLTAILVLVVFCFPSNVIRVILGLPFVLFFPGYVLLAVLYPRKGSISGIGLIALGLGLSLAIIPLIGLLLNYTVWGITLNSILGSETVFIFIMSAAAWFRRSRLPVSERFSIAMEFNFAGIWGPGLLNKALTVGLVLAVLGTLGTIGYVIARPKTGETFTEFYILNTEGKAQDYPKDMTIGETGKVIVGIVNHEAVLTDYKVAIRIGAVKANETDIITLESEETRESEMGFTPETAGSLEVQFFLYRNNDTDPYLSPLRLWINVSE